MLKEVLILKICMLKEVYHTNLTMLNKENTCNIQYKYLYLH